MRTYWNKRKDRVYFLYITPLTRGMHDYASINLLLDNVGKTNSDIKWHGCTLQDGAILPARDTDFVPRGKFTMFWSSLFSQDGWIFASFFFACLWTSTSSWSINLANIQPSWPQAWSVTYTYLWNWIKTATKIVKALYMVSTAAEHHFKIQCTNTDQESNAFHTRASVQVYTLNQTLGLILHNFFSWTKIPKRANCTSKMHA